MTNSVRTQGEITEKMSFNEFRVNEMSFEWVLVSWSEFWIGRAGFRELVAF